MVDVPAPEANAAKAYWIAKYHQLMEETKLVTALLEQSYSVNVKTLEKEEAAKKRKRSNKEKDPNRPKKSPSAYILFCKKERQKITDQNPDMSQNDVLKTLGVKWNALSDKKKLPFEKEAKRLKEERDIQVADYEKSQAAKE